MAEEKPISEILISFTDEQIVHLLNELVFASHFHAIGYEQSGIGIALSLDGEHAGAAISGYVRQKDLPKAILASPLFTALRAELHRRNPDVDFPEGWCSWANLEYRQVQNLKDALKSYYAVKYPASGVLFNQVDPRKVQEATVKARDLGIWGIFVNWETPYIEVDLEKVFRTTVF